MLPETIIKENIANIEAIANNLPGVVIIHDLRDWSVAWMSPRGLALFGTSLEEISALTSEEYHERYFNSEDAKDYVPKLYKIIERNDADEICTFFQQVRFKTTDNWTWHMASIKILAHYERNKPLLTITMAFPIDAMHHMASKASRLLEENNFLRNNYSKFSKLSTREVEVLGLMAKGKSAPETAEILFISLHTVETHRKNIKQKLETSSYFELTQYARSFDLI